MEIFPKKVLQNRNCLICNNFVMMTKLNIFDKNLQTSSKKTVHRILNSVIGDELKENAVHSSVICTKCFTSLNEIDKLQLRLNKMKDVLKNKYQETVIINKLKVKKIAPMVETKQVVEPILIKDDAEEMDEIFSNSSTAQQLCEAFGSYIEKTERVQAENKAAGGADSATMGQLRVEQVPEMEQVLVSNDNQESSNNLVPPNQPVRQPVLNMLEELGLTFVSETGEIIYSNGKYPFLCEICGSSFIMLKYLNMHKRLTHNQTPFMCDKCGKCYKRNRLLKYHFNSKHLNERLFKCDLCDATYTYPEHLKQHRMIHNAAPISCKKCDKVFKNKAEINEHSVTYFNITPYKCHNCNLNFVNECLYCVHQKVHQHDSIEDKTVFIDDQISSVENEIMEMENRIQDAYCGLDSVNTNESLVQDEIKTLEEILTKCDEDTPQPSMTSLPVAPSGHINMEIPSTDIDDFCFLIP